MMNYSKIWCVTFVLNILLIGYVLGSYHWDMLNEKDINNLNFEVIKYGNIINNLNNKIQELEKELELETKKTRFEIDREITIRQGFNPADLRYLIEKVLEYLGEKNIEGFAELLLITAQVESEMGRSRKQNGGPALSVFQIEPSTEKCIWDNYLKYNKTFRLKVEKLLNKNNVTGIPQLRTNLEYATAMAYFTYKRKKANPSKNDLLGLAKLHKEIFNTSLGKSTIRGTLNKIVGVL